MRTGLHANQTRDHAKILDYYRRSGSKVFKTLTFDTPLLDALASMGVTIIGRVYEERQRLGGDDAKRFLDRVLDSARRHPRVSYWEGHNEAWHKPGEIERYAEREIERMKALEAIGKRAVIGNFAVGTPDIEDGSWALFRPALEHAASHGHALGLHEYAGPYMQYMVETPDGRNQWDHAGNRWTGFSDAAETYYQVGLTGWLTLRYRKVYRRFLVPWGLGALPLFITEGGIDNTSPRPGGQGAGWKDFEGSEFAKHTAVGDYAEQRRWYMWQVSHDAFVKGVVDFGWDGTATGWASFDLQNRPDMLGRIIAEEATLPVGHHNATPAPAPAPSPAPTDPLATLLAARLGGRFSDLRTALPRHPSRAYGRLDPARLVGIAVHHSASPVDTTPEAIARHHVDGNGWAGIGYHLVIRRGHVYYVGALDTARAHVADRNHELVGICVTGDYSTTDPAPADTTALRDVIGAIDAYLGRALPVDGHLGWATPGHGTACPGRLLVTARSIRPSTAPGPDLAALRAAAAAEHEARGITLNAAAALQRAIRADGLTPTTREMDFADASGEYVWQRAEALAGGGAMIYYVRRGEWHAVKRVPA